MSTITITISAKDLMAAQSILNALSRNVAAVEVAAEAEPEAETPALTARQQAAANARAAKAAKTPGPVETILGPPDPAPNGDGDQVEDLGLIDPSMSPAEAKDAGLALVRECYAAGKVAEVKSLQKEWGVAKFYDVPFEKGHEFYQRVVQMAVATGLRK